MKFRSKAGVFALLMLSSAMTIAQEYSFRTFGNAEGLNNLSVLKIYQDPVGFLWVSTENGIYRYDGDRFEEFGSARGLPKSEGAFFGEAPDGSLLAGGGFGLYQLRGNRFERIPGPFKTVNWSQGIDKTSEGHTFIGTDAGLLELSPVPGRGGFLMRTVPRVPEASSEHVESVLADGDTVWYGCGTELCRMDKGGTRLYGSESGIAKSGVVAMQMDREGNLWLRLRNRSFYVLPKGSNRAIKPAVPATGIEPHGLPVRDSDGKILIPTTEGLLIREGPGWDAKGWRMIDHSVGLPGDAYTAFEDRQHSLWIGFVGRGLVRWGGYGEWESYSTASGLPSDVVYEILPQDDGTVWAASRGGLLRGRPTAYAMKWQNVPGLDGQINRTLQLGQDGTLWVGTETRGIARLDRSSGKVRWIGAAQGLTSSEVMAIRFDQQKNLWAATGNGLFFARAPYEKFEQIKDLPPDRIWALQVAGNGSIWAGSADGLYALIDGRWRHFDKADGLSGGEVLSIGEGKNGAMWVGYRYGGLIDRVSLGAMNAAANGANSPHFHIERGVQRPGTGGLIYFLSRDSAGKMWVGTEHGVDIWDGAIWSHYGVGDGLAWDDCNLASFAQAGDGTIWIGTSGGLSRFTPRPSRGQQGPIKVVYTRVRIGRKEMDGSQNPSLDTRDNTFSVRYSALNASRENGVVFRYRLVGADDAWTETNQRELQFADLSPGRYRLQVEAQDESGKWSANTADFAFRVLAPWYRAWWFFGLCALIPIAGMIALGQARAKRAMQREREVQRLMEAHDAIRNLAFFDTLTGLPNRRMLLDRLSKTVASSARNGRLHAVLYIDLDDFKMLNDSLGHQMGDLLLREVSVRLKHSVREVDTVARLGGDEFVVILENLSDVPEEAASHAELVAEKILAEIQRPFQLAGHQCLSTSSIGITVFGDERKSSNEVLQQADIAMYQAKKAGRNAVRFFAPALQAAVNARAEMADDLRAAISAGQFVLYYQPQLDHGAVVGAEALVRWHHPKRGILMPGGFVPVAEETGLILALGDWVLEAACRQVAAWSQHRHTAHLRMAVNISVRQFRQPDFVGSVLTILERTGANPESIKLELTESMFMDNVEDVISKMTELKLRGFRFSLDDFGTGYSSLSYLKRLPLDQLKIDRSFVRDILTDTTDGAIAQTVISLSRAMGLSVMAEGVETEEQREFLAKLGCHAFQGYLFSKPVTAEDFEQMLLNRADEAATMQH